MGMCVHIGMSRAASAQSVSEGNGIGMEDGETKRRITWLASGWPVGPRCRYPDAGAAVDPWVLSLASLVHVVRVL